MKRAASLSLASNSRRPALLGNALSISVANLHFVAGESTSDGRVLGKNARPTSGKLARPNLSCHRSTGNQFHRSTPSTKRPRDHNVSRVKQGYIGDGQTLTVLWGLQIEKSTNVFADCMLGHVACESCSNMFANHFSDVNYVFDTMNS